MVDDIAETDNRIVVPAKEILEKIEKKESVEYHNITIDGDLDLSKLSLQTKPIKRTSYDSGVLNLPKENKVVVSSIKINFSKIMGIINFKGVSFQNGVDFKATNFIKYANLCGVQFEESANFSQAVFCETADFERSEFFWESRFHGSRFIKKADFSGAVFRGNTWFSESYFSLDANFYEAEFKNEAYFTKAYFGDRLNLDKSKINYVSLADITCGKNCHITLQASNFTRLEARWDSLRNYLIYDGPMYLSLTKNYNNLEWFEDADDCYYHYRIEKRAGLNAWSKILDYIIWVAYGYGVRPQNPLMLGVILVLLSAFIFWLGSQRQSMTDSLYLSVIVFISSPEIDQLTGLCKLWGLFERLMGWLLMALFLVTLGRVTIR